MEGKKSKPIKFGIEKYDTVNKDDPGGKSSHSGWFGLSKDPAHRWEIGLIEDPRLTKRQTMLRTPPIIRHEAGHAVLHKYIYDIKDETGFVVDPSHMKSEVEVAVWELYRTGDMKFFKKRINGLMNRAAHDDWSWSTELDEREFKDWNEIGEYFSRLINRAVLRMKNRERKK